MRLPEHNTSWAVRLSLCLKILTTMILTCGLYALSAQSSSSPAKKELPAYVAQQYVVMVWDRACMDLAQDAHAETTVDENGVPDFAHAKISGVVLHKSCARYEVRKK